MISLEKLKKRMANKGAVRMYVDAERQRAVIRRLYDEKKFLSFCAAARCELHDDFRSQYGHEAVLHVGDVLQSMTTEARVEYTFMGMVVEKENLSLQLSDWDPAMYRQFKLMIAEVQLSPITFMRYDNDIVLRVFLARMVYRTYGKRLIDTVSEKYAWTLLQGERDI